MRPLTALIVFLAMSLACGGGGFAPEVPPKASTGTAFGSNEGVPPPPPEPAPVPAPVAAPAPPGGFLAVIGPFQGRDVAIVCTLDGTKIDCPVGPCGEDGSCAPGAEIKVVGTASVGGDTVAMSLGMAMLSSFSEEFCSGTSAEVADVGEQTAPRPTVAVDGTDPAVAGVAAIIGDGVEYQLNAYRLDVDGVEGTEILAEATTSNGSVLMLVREGAAPAIVYDTRHEPLADDIDDYARHEYEMSWTTLTWLGVTDAELDGELEIVIEGSGFESSWIAVLNLDGTTLGSIGCVV